jgi:hypothetical protein
MTNYRQLDLNVALDLCMTLPWSDFYRTLDPNERLSILNDFMTGLFDEFVPLKTRRCAILTLPGLTVLLVALCLSVTSPTNSGR